MKKTWMLDTNICSFIMREQPAAVLKRLEQAVLRDRIVVSAGVCRDALRRHRPEGLAALFSWSTRSARASMPSCPGTAPRWTPRRTSGWRCASPVRPERHGHCRARHRGGRHPGDDNGERRVPALVLEDWVK
jgi:tRNA(fMet)-specific endonuclease VapC